MKDNMSGEMKEFLRSIDFMRVGQAINHEQWQSAFMTLRRLMERAKACECDTFDRQFAGLKYAIQRKDKREAQQVLSLIVTKRARMLNEIALPVEGSENG